LSDAFKGKLLLLGSEGYDDPRAFSGYMKSGFTGNVLLYTCLLFINRF
jgi:hypothetical protein